MVSLTSSTPFNVVQHKVPFPILLEARSMLQMEETRLSKQQKPTARHDDTSSSPTVLYAGSDGNPQNSNNNFNNSGRGNKGRNRGGGRFRGRGRSSNNWQQQQHVNPYASPWYYQQAPPVYPPFNPYPAYHAYSPHFTHHQPRPGNTGYSGILGSHPSTPSHQAHMAQQAAPPQMTQLPAALNHAFNTMTLQEPDNAWYMDSGASTHITATQVTYNPSLILAPCLLLPSVTVP